jgi:hypothetical protein
MQDVTKPATFTKPKFTLCGDGFMDFKLKSQRFGSWLCFRPQVN